MLQDFSSVVACVGGIPFLAVMAHINRNAMCCRTFLQYRRVFGGIPFLVVMAHINRKDFQATLWHRIHGLPIV